MSKKIARRFMEIQSISRRSLSRKHCWDRLQEACPGWLQSHQEVSIAGSSLSRSISCLGLEGWILFCIATCAKMLLCCEQYYVQLKFSSMCWKSLLYAQVSAGWCAISLLLYYPRNLVLCCWIHATIIMCKWSAVVCLYWGVLVRRPGLCMCAVCVRAFCPAVCVRAYWTNLFCIQRK